ncbi:MAG TPA: hypothetical protein VJ821_06780 [Anaerolineales bacterium]|nr:hypothetical protein [Anaerolineales bacterium]
MKSTITKKQLADWIFSTLREAAWAPITVLIFYFIGRALGLYELFPPLDMPSHFFGGVAITYFYRSAIRNAQSITGDIPFFIQVLLAFTATGTTIILWEFYENLSDFLFDTHMVRGLEDTIVDMLVGLVGALVLTIFYQRR